MQKSNSNADERYWETKLMLTYSCLILIFLKHLVVKFTRLVKTVSIKFSLTIKIIFRIGTSCLEQEKANS